MEYEKLWNDLLAEARRDEEYRWHLEAVRRAETAYLAVCDTLSPDQRQTVEDYITACEAQDDYMLLLAYRLGCREG